MTFGTSAFWYIFINKSLVPWAHAPSRLVIYYGNVPHGRDINITTMYITSIQGVESATFVLQGQLCPAGYVLRTNSSLSVCVCNEDIEDVLLCKEDQDTIIIKVPIGRLTYHL